MKSYAKILTNFKEWFEQEALRDGYSVDTISIYIKWADYFLNYLEQFKILSLNDIDHEIIRDFLSARLDKLTGKKITYAASSARSRISALNLFFTWAYKARYCRENPMTQYKKLKIKTRTNILTKKKKSIEQQSEYLTSTEQKQILEFQTGGEFTLVRDKAIVLLILASAAFADEVITLPVSNLDIQKGYLKVGEKDRRLREISLDLTLCKQACNEWLNLRKQVLGNQKFPLLFFSINQLSLSNRMLYKIISNFLLSVTSRKNEIGPDTLRQSAILNWFRNKLPIEEIQARTAFTLETLEKYKKIIQLESSNKTKIK